MLDRDAESGSVRPNWGATLNWGLGALGMCLLFIHGCILAYHSVDVPFGDEWEYFLPNALGQKISFDWLVAQHNEHRIMFTKLLAWTLLHVADLNFTVNTVINFLMYCAICFLLMRLIKRDSRAPLGLVSILFASMVLQEVHSWPFLSQFHFYALFFILGLMALRKGSLISWLVVPCAIASAYSFAAGFFCGITLGLAALICAWLRPKERAQQICQGVICLVGVSTWLMGFQKNPGHPPFESPLKTPFWTHLFGTMAGGLGLDSDGLVSSFGTIGLSIGACLLTLVIALFFLEVRDLVARGPSAEKATIRMAYVGALLLAMCATSSARASFSSGIAVPGRYLYPVILLLPMLWAMTYERLLSKRKLSMVCGAALFILPQLNNMDFRRYGPNHQKAVAARACMDSYFQNGGTPICPVLYPGDLSTRFARARELNISCAQP